MTNEEGRMTNDEWQMTNDEWTRMNDEWRMTKEQGWMMNDEWRMTNDEWTMRLLTSFPLTNSDCLSRSTSQLVLSGNGFCTWSIFDDHFHALSRNRCWAGHFVRFSRFILYWARFAQTSKKVRKGIVTPSLLIGHRHWAIKDRVTKLTKLTTDKTD